MISLYDDIDQKAIASQLKNGILTITLPRVLRYWIEKLVTLEISEIGSQFANIFLAISIFPSDLLSVSYYHLLRSLKVRILVPTLLASLLPVLL